MTSLSVPTGDPDDSDDEPFINCIAADPSSRFLRIVEAGRPRRAYEPTLRRDAALIPPPATPNRFCCGDAISLRGGRAS